MTDETTLARTLLKFSHDKVFPQDIQQSVQAEARNAALTFLQIINAEPSFVVCTAESLTAGAIMATLVDVPYAGRCKWGNFGVYNTAAKEKYLGVTVRNEDWKGIQQDTYPTIEDTVYSRRCAAQMAVGALTNSRTDKSMANLAIAVTGQAMPVQGKEVNEETLGQVWIGLASYCDEQGRLLHMNEFNKLGDDVNALQIRVDVQCLDATQLIPYLGDTWKKRPHDERSMNVELQYPPAWIDGYNDMFLTSIVSRIVRYTTVECAIRLAIQFISSEPPSALQPVSILRKDVLTNDVIGLQNDMTNQFTDGVVLNDLRAATQGR